MNGKDRDVSIHIKVKEKNLFFLDVPVEYKNFVVANYGFAGAYLMENESKGLNHWKIKIPSARYEVLGFVKDVIPATECVETDKNFVLKKF